MEEADIPPPGPSTHPLFVLCLWRGGWGSLQLISVEGRGDSLYNGLAFVVPFLSKSCVVVRCFSFLFQTSYATCFAVSLSLCCPKVNPLYSSLGLPTVIPFFPIHVKILVLNSYIMCFNSSLFMYCPKCKATIQPSWHGLRFLAVLSTPPPACSLPLILCETKACVVC